MSDPATPAPISSRSWRSFLAVLVVQSQNAFNDNFVKLVLIGLAVTVAADSAIGDNIEFVLAAMIPIPFILLAPLAGWFSDRFSKSRVIYLCLVLQILIFGLIAFSLVIQSVRLAIFGYFLLAVQSTLFSPAKQGILKEIVGSKRLGFANGLTQMLTMAGILGGMAVGGGWFDSALASINVEEGISADNAWRAALIPMMGIGLIALIPLVLGLFIQRTPSYSEKKFDPLILVSHFFDLGYLFRQPVLRRTGLLIASYWLIANFLGLAFFGFAKELYPDVEKGGVSSSSGFMFICVGIGLIVGSLIVSFITRKGNRLGLSILGALGMATGLIGVGLFTPEANGLADGITGLGLLTAETRWWLASVIAVGFASGFFVVPLNAHLQDQIEESHRGRVLSAQNLLGSISGILAIAFSSLMKASGLSVATQVLVFVPIIFIIGYFVRPLAAPPKPNA